MISPRLRRQWRRLPLALLRLLLAIGLLAALALVVVGIVLATAAPAEEDASEWGNWGSAMALVAVLLLVPLLLAATLPLAWALCRHRPGVARFGLLLLFALLVVDLVPTIADVRDDLECDEMRAGLLVVPLLLSTLLLAALAPTSLAALGLRRSSGFARLRRTLLVLAALLVSADLAAIASARQPAASALAHLEAGMTYRDLVALLEPHCFLDGRDDRRLVATCVPVAPPICRCAPVLAPTIRLELDANRRLVKIERSATLRGLRSER